MPQWVGKTGQLTFVRTVNGAPTLFLKRTDAVGEEQVLVANARFPTVTADGRRIVFNRRPAGQTAWEVAWLDVDRPTEVHALGPAHSGARFPAVSPDGRLVAYISGEIGNDEIFLTRFPSGEGKWQLSTEGGGWCRFTPKGDAVVYRTPGGDLMSVPVTLGADVTIGRPRKLFEWGSGWMLFYELAARRHTRDRGGAGWGSERSEQPVARAELARRVRRTVSTRIHARDADLANADCGSRTGRRSRG